MDFVPDYKEAKKKSRDSVANPDLFETYSCAYIVTNEDLRHLPKLMPKKHKKILSVVGSGDHPLWFSLYGAERIDTFDVSYNAKILMDIKVAALSCLNWQGYKHLLENLFNFCCRENPSVQMSQVKDMGKILPKLPKPEAEYINALGSTKIFRTGWEPKKSESLPSFLEYLRLRAKVKQPYNFYLTDIKKLGDFLTTSYDVIHLSNIMDYIPTTEHQDVILPLLNHVNPGGRIIAHNMVHGWVDGYFNYFGDTALEIADSFSGWRYIQEKLLMPQFAVVLWNGTHILERIG